MILCFTNNSFFADVRMGEANERQNKIGGPKKSEALVFYYNLGLAIQECFLKNFGNKKAELYFTEALHQYQIRYENRSSQEVLCAFGFAYGKVHKVEVGDSIPDIVNNIVFEAKDPMKDGKRTNVSTKSSIAEVVEVEGPKKRLTIALEEIDSPMTDEISTGDWEFDELNVSN